MDSPVAVLLVADAVGITTLEYLLNKHSGPVRLPNLARLGLGRLVKGGERLGKPGNGFAMRVEQASASADSVIGHREMMGIVDGGTYSLFPDGFPAEYIKELERKIGRKTIFNKMAGGMEAIELNAAEHEKTGFPIVYASKCDPLIQIAMDEAVIPVSEQHKIADAAFALARDMKIPVTRAIARAYVRTAGGLARTANRHDAVLPMERKTLVDILYSEKVWTVSVGKTGELVNTVYHEKIKLSDPAFVSPQLQSLFVHPQRKDTNPLSAQGTLNAVLSAKAVWRPKGTFIFSNLVDTDSLYGHTRDVAGSLAALEGVDKAVGILEAAVGKGGLLIITADHGMAHREDYGYHNKEPLPLLAEIAGENGLGKLKAGKGRTLADAGWLVSQYFGCEEKFAAESGLAHLF